jgi:uncharacterized alkaline shock family protein YloU
MADSIIIKNEYGKITVTKSVVAQIITDVVDATGGVSLANFKRLFGVRKPNIEIDFDDDGNAQIKVYIVINLGTSISNSTYALINEIKNRITLVTEKTPLSISIKVVGTQTKHRVAKRDIEAKREYDINE